MFEKMTSSLAPIKKKQEHVEQNLRYKSYIITSQRLCDGNNNDKSTKQGLMQ